MHFILMADRREKDGWLWRSVPDPCHKGVVWLFCNHSQLSLETRWKGSEWRTPADHAGCTSSLPHVLEIAESINLKTKPPQDDCQWGIRHYCVEPGANSQHFSLVFVCPISRMKVEMDQNEVLDTRSDFQLSSMGAGDLQAVEALISMTEHWKMRNVRPKEPRPLTPSSECSEDDSVPSGPSAMLGSSFVSEL